MIWSSLVKRTHLIKGIVFISFLFLSLQGRAELVKRTLLGMWDSTEYEGADSSANEIHQNLEAILNHYGLKVEYIDVAKSIPPKFKDPKILRNYRGVVSWFTDDQMNSPLEYLSFLSQVRKAKIPLLIMGDFGFLLKALIKKL